ncbi:MAG: hypothetical protein ABI626_11010 [Sphingomicrobium sp.]
MLVSLFVLAVVTSVDLDPLARGRLGEAQCYMPDVLFKTCVSLEYYSPTGPGTYSNRAISLVEINQPTVIDYTVPVEIRGKAVCFTLRSAHLLAGKISNDGRPLSREKSAAILARINKRTAAVRDKEGCAMFESADGGMFVARGTVGGVRRPDLDSPFKWVKPSDGYKVAP